MRRVRTWSNCKKRKGDDGFKGRQEDYSRIMEAGGLGEGKEEQE